MKEKNNFNSICLDIQVCQSGYTKELILLDQFETIHYTDIEQKIKICITQNNDEYYIFNENILGKIIQYSPKKLASLPKISETIPAEDIFILYIELNADPFCNWRTVLNSSCPHNFIIKNMDPEIYNQIRNIFLMCSN